MTELKKGALTSIRVNEQLIVSAGGWAEYAGGTRYSELSGDWDGEMRDGGWGYNDEALNNSGDR
jgi:hypothetical protein